MSKTKQIEPIYKKTHAGGIQKIGYKVNEITTDKNGEVIKLTVLKIKLFK